MTQSEARPGPRWLTSNLVVLTAISFFQDAASELLYPLLPLLVTGALAAPPVILGVIEGLADATAGLTKYLAGRWSDRHGRKPFIGAGYGLAALGKVLVAAATAWPLVLFGRVVDRFGKGLRSAPRDALIAGSVPEAALGRAFGFHRMGDSAGAVIGPLLGLWALSAMGGDLHATLWWAVIPATISALLVVAVRDHRRGATTSTAPGAPAAASERPPEAAHPPLPRAFWRVTTALVLVSLVNFSDALLLLRIAELGFGTTEVVLAYVLFNLVYTLGSYPAGALTDRWPAGRSYALGLVAFAIGYVGVGLVSAGPWVFVLVAVYGLFPALTDGVGKAWISSLVPAGRRGHAQGVFQGLTAGAVLVAGLWAGLLWSVGPGKGVVPLVVAGVAALAAAVHVARIARTAGR